jgi:hypothetical protein
LNNSFNEERAGAAIQDGPAARRNLIQKLRDVVSFGGDVPDQIGGEAEQAHVALQKGGGV